MELKFKNKKLLETKIYKIIRQIINVLEFEFALIYSTKLSCKAMD